MLGGLAVVSSIGLIAAIPRPGGPTIPVVLQADPNTAPADVLLALPGLGPSRVSAIISARETAPFRSADDLDRRVKGIGPTTMSGLVPYLRFDPPSSPGR